jgi:hypothetical protein
MTPPSSGSKRKQRKKLAEQGGYFRAATQTLSFQLVPPLPGLDFDRDDEGDKLLRNVGLSPNYKALQRRRPYSAE